MKYQVWYQPSKISKVFWKLGRTSYPAADENLFIVT